MARKTRIDDVEILFVERSTRDRKGRRVLLRLNGTENALFQSEGLSDIDVKLWNLSPEYRAQIESFLEADG